jgi:hypothetical protein
MTPSSTPRLQLFTRAHTPGVIDLLAAEGCDTYTVDPGFRLTPEQLNTDRKPNACSRTQPVAAVNPKEER